MSRRFEKRTVLAVLALACCAALAWPRAVAAQPRAALELPELETWQLDNGLTVAFMRKTTAPVVAVEVWYHAGSKDERPKRRGSAHMFEHMMFKGTEHVRPEEHARHLNRLGGYVNAFTTEDATAYVNVLPADYLAFAMKLEAERMRNLLFRKDMIDTEREVVKEEIRRAENNPIQKGLLAFFEAAYDVHPYSWTAGGTIADLDKTTPGDLEAFYDTYYVPNNALLIVVGDVDRASVEAAAEEYFGAIPRGKEPPRRADDKTEPPQKKKKLKVVDPGQIGLVIGGYHIPAAEHRDIYALQVLQLILGGGESSRLNQRLVRNDKIAVQAGATAVVREHPGLFALVGAFIDPSKREAVHDALLEEVAKITAKGPSDREVRKAKNQLQAGFAFGLQSAAGLAQQIGTSWILTGDPEQFLRDLDEFEKVTAAEVQRVAKTYLTEDNMTVAIIPVKTR